MGSERRICLCKKRVRVFSGHLDRLSHGSGVADRTACKSASKVKCYRESAAWSGQSRMSFCRQERAEQLGELAERARPRELEVGRREKPDEKSQTRKTQARAERAMGGALQDTGDVPGSSINGLGMASRARKLSTSSASPEAGSTRMRGKGQKHLRSKSSPAHSSPRATW